MSEQGEPLFITWGCFWCDKSLLDFDFLPGKYYEWFLLFIFLLCKLVRECHQYWCANYLRRFVYTIVLRLPTYTHTHTHTHFRSKSTYCLKVPRGDRWAQSWQTNMASCHLPYLMRRGCPLDYTPSSSLSSMQKFVLVNVSIVDWLVLVTSPGVNYPLLYNTCNRVLSECCMWLSWSHLVHSRSSEVESFKLTPSPIVL